MLSDIGSFARDKHISAPPPWFMAAVFFFVRLPVRKHDPCANVRVLVCGVRAEGLNGCGTTAALEAVGSVETGVVLVARCEVLPRVLRCKRASFERINASSRLRGRYLKVADPEREIFAKSENARVSGL